MPHLQAHGKVGDCWDGVHKEFVAQFPKMKPPALTTLKAYYEKLLKQLKNKDQLTYLSGSDQELKPHFEELRSYLGKIEAWEVLNIF